MSHTSHSCPCKPCSEAPKTCAAKTLNPSWLPFQANKENKKPPPSVKKKKGASTSAGGDEHPRPSSGGSESSRSGGPCPGLSKKGSFESDGSSSKGPAVAVAHRQPQASLPAKRGRGRPCKIIDFTAQAKEAEAVADKHLQPLRSAMEVHKKALKAGSLQGLKSALKKRRQEPNNERLISHKIVGMEWESTHKDVKTFAVSLSVVVNDGQ